MKLIVLTGLPTKEKAWLTRDLAAHYSAQGQRVAVMDNANIMNDLGELETVDHTVLMRGGCACCSVADKLFRSTTELSGDIDVAIMPANNQTHVDNLVAVLDNLVSGSPTPIEVTMVALVDDRTTCCFPYVAETLESYADITLHAPFSPDAVISAV
ncbi:MAG: hypothetical protein AAFU54_27115 [Chloroflexota bacterium]